ncbi:hypothetical protein ANTRET_LOCUS5124 [Anthophora retusa]
MSIALEIFNWAKLLPEDCFRSTYEIFNSSILRVADSRASNSRNSSTERLCLLKEYSSLLVYLRYLTQDCLALKNNLRGWPLGYKQHLVGDLVITENAGLRSARENIMISLPESKLQGRIKTIQRMFLTKAEETNATVTVGKRRNKKRGRGKQGRNWNNGTDSRLCGTHGMTS